MKASPGFGEKAQSMKSNIIPFPINTGARAPKKTAITAAEKLCNGVKAVKSRAREGLKRAAEVAGRILAEEAARARGRVGRKPSGRVTWALIERLEMAGRGAEARQIMPLVSVEVRKTPRVKRDTEREADWDARYARHRVRRLAEVAAEAEAERAQVAQREAVEKSARREAGAVMLRFSLPALKAAAFRAVAGGAGLRMGDTLRAMAAALARLSPAEALRELARLAALPAADPAGAMRAG